MYKISPFPVLATAVSKDTWYSWVSPGLFEMEHPSTLIPFGPPMNHKVIIGHNVSYDRARIAEEYQLQKSNFQFIDTQSLHSSVGGLSSQQRPYFLTYMKAKRTMGDLTEIQRNTKEMMEINPLLWEENGTTNGLAAIADFYLKIKLDKSDRDYFSQTNMDLFEDEFLFQKMMKYCSKDVEITCLLFKKLLPKFQTKCPHPVSFSGMLQMNKGFLPTDITWNDYLKSASDKYMENQKKIEKTLFDIIDELLVLENGGDDFWLRNIDWERKPIRMTKGKSNAKTVIEPKPMANQNLELVGKPGWYCSLWCTKSKQIKISLSKSIAPYLLRLQWKSNPLVNTKTHGWCYHSLPDFKTSDLKIKEEDIKEDLGDLYLPGRNYYRVPHPGGDSNCGKPLSKNFMKAFEADVLTSNHPKAKELLKLHAQGTYWLSSRERILSQMVVWDRKGELTGSKEAGVIVPLTIAMGTVTRRATESTWLTASNAKINSIGSELKAKIKAPPGYKIVGADVDSQELWIASLLGDSQFGFHGSTAIGFMTLQGTKSQATDLHSVTGKIVGISRDIAKIFNYSRIYGAGVKYATELLVKHVPGLAKDQAKIKAEKLFSSTKGIRFRSSKCEPFWFGGTESFMFNVLEKIAKATDSRTPVLNCQIPDTLKSEATNEKVNLI
jgi:DNA polymerase gamma 1